MQNFVVISESYFKLEHSKFRLNSNIIALVERTTGAQLPITIFGLLVVFGCAKQLYNPLCMSIYLYICQILFTVFLSSWNLYIRHLSNEMLVACMFSCHWKGEMSSFKVLSYPLCSSLPTTNLLHIWHWYSPGGGIVSGTIPGQRSRSHKFCCVCCMAPCLFDRFPSYVIQIQPMRGWCVAHHFQLKGQGHRPRSKF